MGQVSIDIATEATSQKILETVNMIKAMVVDVENFDWKAFWANMATGELFSTKFYNYTKSTSPAGEKMNDSVGMVAKPSTDKAQNRDDFAGRNAFSYIDCNFICNENKQRIPTAIQGGSGYAKTGKVDVGILVPPTYWGKEEHDDYYIIHFSDTPHPEVGCTTPTPWTDPELGYGIVTKYYAGQIDGKLYSSSGNPVFNFVSAQSGNTELLKKGTGYMGSGSERTAYLLCMLWIKYATKNSQTVFPGCTSYDLQYKVAEAGEGVNYVVLTTAQANKFWVGSTVSIGDAGSNSSLDRGSSYMRNIADKVKILSIELIEGTSNSRVYVDKTGMTITATTYISTMPLHSGTTDGVLGADGQVATDSKHAFKLGGIEEGIGAYYISMTELWNKTSGTVVDYYTRGTAAWSSTGSGWSKVATVDLGTTTDQWLGDIDIDLTTGIHYTKTFGSGGGVGVGDILYKGGTGTGWREPLQRGSLRGGSRAGFSYADLWDGVSNAGWYCALCI